MTPLLKQRNFVFLWAAHAAAGLGDTLLSVGLMVAVFEQTGSALQTAGILVANALPNFALSPWGGVLADRWSRKRLLVGTTAVRAAIVAVLLPLAGGAPADVPALWGAYAVVAGLSAALAIYTPARLSLLPTLVARPDLVRANSLLVGTGQATLALGFVVGGWLAQFLSLQTFVGLVLGAFLLSGALLLPIRSTADRGGPVAAPASAWRAFREGLRALRRHAVARPLVVMEVLEHVPHGIWTSALMLVFVEQALGGGSGEWGAQNGAFFAGQLVGALAAAGAARWLARRAGWTIVVNAALAAALTALYAFSPNNAVAVAVSFCFGPPYAVRDVAQDTLLQTTVPAGVLGRVYATRDMFRSLTFMLAGLGFAALADQVPIRAIYLLGGALYLGTALYALANKPLRTSRIEAAGPPHGA